MEKSYRLHTDISKDSVLNVNMRQDFDFLEVLSLKLSQEDAYKLHTSNYGVIVGRVLANEAFGIPNAKVSVFVERDDNDTVDIENIYPYKTVRDKDADGRRFNLLPDYSDDECYRVVGTFPNKRLVLDDQTYLDVFDKYYRYTTVTNQAGDYMIFGIPSGSQQLHVDIDLSDIGVLSQKPRDFVYKGYNLNMFDNVNQFRESTNLESLAQIFSQDRSVNVYPFWGDSDTDIIALTRADIQIQYKFEPTCVFMGSIVSDNGSNAIGPKCNPGVKNGMNNQLVTGEGTIEMIRKTTDGLVEEYQIQGNQLIDSDGVWCYQIPMNLDYIGTDEYGNIVPTDNPTKGIPTRAQVRFRFSKSEGYSESNQFHTAKYLVPMNPSFDENQVVPTINVQGSEIENMYAFGSSTPQNCFRDLYWNNVYSVKNYIPRVQNTNRSTTTHYTGLKGANLATDQNEIPFNKLRVDIPFTYMIICIIFTIVMYVIYFINTIICLLNILIGLIIKILDVRIPVIRVYPLRWLRKGLKIDYLGCISLSAGLNEGNVAYYPGCSCSNGLKAASCPEDLGSTCKKSDDRADLEDAIQQALALDYDIIKLDFYQDWLNGSLYMPLWHWRKAKKKKFLFFTIRGAKNDYCSCDRSYGKLKTLITCSAKYLNNKFKINGSDVPESEKKWHKKRSSAVGFLNGLIKEVENKDGLKTYYYSVLQASLKATNPSMPMSERDEAFEAVLLYATDIILLGNLNKDNLYGLPQFYKNLPSTTANVPPIATVEESTTVDAESTSDSEIFDTDDKGSVVTTGMDWGHDGGSKSPAYQSGLFMDLSCTYANTRAKSCFNVERLSELGSNLDMSYRMPYPAGGDVQYGDITADGFISKLELDDMENRAMFATMNHIGFIPQAYQDEKGAYTTQVEDENTNYLIPKMKYIYPVDFDGRMRVLMERYTNGSQQPLTDEYDDAYVTFRMGAESGSVSKNNEKRIRHFYINNSGSFEMPLYNNSFYFFFGVNKGNTAIDKFNNMFDSECFKNDKIPFSLIIDKQSRAFCPETYPDSEESDTSKKVYALDNPKNLAYGYIRVTLEDIQKPYSYALYDSTANLIITEGEMTVDDFVIGGVVDDSGVEGQDGKVHGNVDGVIKYQDEEGTVLSGSYGTDGLTNQLYKLVITDVNGKSITQRISLEQQGISFSYTTKSLGVKFYDTSMTDRDYICDEDNRYYGLIDIDGFTIDGYECIVKADSMTLLEETDNGIGFDVSAVCKTNTSLEFKIHIFIENNGDGTAASCTCMTDGTPPSPRIKIVCVDGECKIEAHIYQPTSFTVTATQWCGVNKDIMSDNVYNTSVSILNGKNFNAYINTMPLRFLLGTDSNVSELNSSSFYLGNEEVATDLTNHSMEGWLNPQKVTSYKFLPVSSVNAKIWEDFVNLGNGIDEASSKRAIIKYKFDKMFALSEGIFATNASSCQFRMTADGGVSPILYRSASPYFASASEFLEKYILSDVNQVTYFAEYPYIVGNNYGELPTFEWTPWGGSPDNRPIEASAATYHFNWIYGPEHLKWDDEDKKIGSYFGAFTHDGGYSANTGVDTSIHIMNAPFLASVISGKQKGRDVKGSINDELIKNVYAKKKSYLRAMNVDRRFDYNLILIGPINYESFSFPHETWTDWMNARLFGYTMNGIEMSFDENYNLLTANEFPTAEDGGLVTSATVSYKTEYSFSYKHGTYGDAVLTYNQTPLIPRRPIATMVNDADLFHLPPTRRVPTDEGRSRLEIAVISGVTQCYEKMTGDYGEGTYPTKRYLSAALFPDNAYTFSNTGCSYDVQASIDERGHMSAEVQEGEVTEFDIPFESPIRFVTDSTEDYANVRMNPTGGGVTVTFTTNKFDFKFNMVNRSNDAFEIYTKFPRLLFASYNGQNMIRYIKQATSYDDLSNRINRSCGHEYYAISYDMPDNVDFAGTEGAMFERVIRRDRKILKGDNFAHMFYLKGDETPLPASDAAFSKILCYSKNRVNMSGVEVAAFLLDSEYVYNDDDNLERCLRVIEFSEMFDLRPIDVTCLVTYGERWMSYVEYEEYETDRTTINEDGDEVPVMASGNVQTLSFELPVTKDTNQTLVNFENLSFRFKFSSRRIGTFYYDAVVDEASSVEYDETVSAMTGSIIITVKWNPEIGIITDYKWRSFTTATLYVKTSSGFVYQIGPFSFKNLSLDTGSSTGTKTKLNQFTITN